MGLWVGSSARPFSLLCTSLSLSISSLTAVCPLSLSLSLLLLAVANCAGDGRNLLLATDVLGFASAIGVENNPLLVWASRLRARWAGHAERIAIHRDDLLDGALPQPPSPIVIYLYLSSYVMSGLAPRLECAYGSRRALVLSRDFEVPGWGPPDHRLERGRTVLRAYRVPQPRAHLCGRRRR